MSKRVQNKVVITVLICVFALYNVIIYTQKNGSRAPAMNDLALAGEMLWQNNNCAACHQLYGLGGYLGPDLTNTFSQPAKGETYIKAFLNSGIGAMPEFNFSEEEKIKLTEFLKHVDRTGYYPVENAEFQPNGWVKIDYK